MLGHQPRVHGCQMWTKVNSPLSLKHFQSNCVKAVLCVFSFFPEAGSLFKELGVVKPYELSVPGSNSPTLPPSHHADLGTVCYHTDRERKRLQEEHWGPPRSWTVSPSSSAFDQCKGIYFFFLLREPDPTGSVNLDLWVPPLPSLLSPTHKSTCTCRHFSEQVCPPAGAPNC